MLPFVLSNYDRRALDPKGLDIRYIYDKIRRPDKPLRIRRHRNPVSLLPFLWSIWLASSLVSAQKSQAVCPTSWSWANNEAGASPCLVAAQLLSLCSNAFMLPAGGVYSLIGSSASTSTTGIRANICSCNVVMYNLLSACQACQGGDSSSILSWQAYASPCTTCYSETGIQPGPCKAQVAIGFPNSVTPNSFSVAIPAWAYSNSSAGTFIEASARRAAGSSGGDRTTLKPFGSTSAPASTASKDSSAASDSNSRGSSSSTPKATSSQGSLSTPVKAAVIACSAAAGIVAIIFSFYLWSLCLRKRKERRRKEFSDNAFDTVEIARKRKSEKRDRSPRKMTFKRVMDRLTMTAFPKTPMFPPKTPKTPTFNVKTPKTAVFGQVATPKTARFPKFTFGDVFSPKRNRASSNSTMQTDSDKGTLNMNTSVTSLNAPPPPRKVGLKNSQPIS